MRGRRGEDPELSRAARAALRLSDPRSLRWKIVAGVALATIAMALGMGVLVHRTTETRSMGIARGAALRELDAAVGQFERERAGERVPDEHRGYRLGAEVPDDLLARLGSGSEPVTWYDDRKPTRLSMWAARNVEGQALAVSYDMTFDDLSRKALDRHMRYAAVATLAVVLPSTLLAAELVLRRLRRVAGTARRIRHGELDARTGGRAGKDEIGEISSAVDHMADALQERLRTEQRFTADVAHELRTPLAGLVTASSLLPEGEATELVQDRVRVLRGLVDDLLEVSRLDAGAERADAQPVPLGELVADSVRRTGLDARVDVVGEPVVRTDPRRLDRIVGNLVVNAHRHGGAPVRVTVEGVRVVVRDGGPGFPAEILEHGPQRFRTGAAERGHGHGLGLTIATGQAHVIGARLELANDPAGGAVATLVLPAQGTEADALEDTAEDAAGPSGG
ncbi:HAMP domain-containing sensor histidine kinase [Streptomyces sp. NPDC001941]|uniref:sensor histidine kinase n=1 Tax=Streptomyces sp. NPDC001941 TaxID=3154659 RepID=UPI003324EA63